MAWVGVYGGQRSLAFKLTTVWVCLYKHTKITSLPKINSILVTSLISILWKFTTLIPSVHSLCYVHLGPWPLLLTKYHLQITTLAATQAQVISFTSVDMLQVKIKFTSRFFFDLSWLSIFFVSLACFMNN